MRGSNQCLALKRAKRPLKALSSPHLRLSVPAISCLAPHGAAVYELVNVLVTLIVFSPLFGACEEEVDPGLLRFVTGLLLRVFVHGGVDVGRISAEPKGFFVFSHRYSEAQVCIGHVEHFHSALRGTEPLSIWLGNVTVTWPWVR